MSRRLLYLLVFVQIFTHLFWLSPSVHSGQVAIPWMMNQGRSLFGDIWEQHAPGSSLLGAAAQSLLHVIDPALLVKLLNTLLAVALTLLIYQLARRLSGKESAGVLAALVFAWWEPVYGNVMLYFDTLLAVCVLSALVIYCRSSEQPSTRQIILIGLLMGLATLFKQHAWLAVGVMGIWLLLYERRRQIWLLYGAAALLLPLLQWAVLAGLDLLESYRFWNWTFNLTGYMDGVPLDGDLFRKLLLTNLLVFPFALLALRENRRGILLVLMWLATLTVLYPRFGEIHAMGHLPFTAVMSGVVLAKLLPAFTVRRNWDTPHTVLAGLAIAIGIGWLWTGAVSYIPTEVGPGAILANDEFQELSRMLRERADEGDTLFVLPETDSTPQIHPQSGMLPPGTWIKGWRWYLKPETVLETLTQEWEEAPPTWIVVFPDLTGSGEPGIQVLLDIVDERYQFAFDVGDIFGHGRADVYQLSDRSN